MHIILAVLTIAAASDLQPVMPRVAAAFERATGHTVTVAYGSSGNFFAQISNGAPYDVYLSADVSYPRQLASAGLTVPGSLVIYAKGSLVVWTRRASGIHVEAGLTALLDERVRRIAIANPAHAPYGRAAVAAMTSAGVYDRVKAKLVLGENVSQAAQFVQSGNADAGILPLSLAKESLDPTGLYSVVPASLYPAIEQAAVVLRRSREPDAARAFVQFLQTREAEDILAQAGFTR